MGMAIRTVSRRVGGEPFWVGLVAADMSGVVGRMGVDDAADARAFIGAGVAAGGEEEPTVPRLRADEEAPGVLDGVA